MDKSTLDNNWWRRIQGPTESALGLPSHYHWSEHIGRRSAAYQGEKLAPLWDRDTQHFAGMIAEAIDPDARTAS